MRPVAPRGTANRPLVASRQWQGTRTYQEDDFGTLAGGEASDGSLLLVLADGMGGEAGGATASGTVVSAFLDRFPRATGGVGVRLRSCLEAATARLRQQVKTDTKLTGMGSTVVAVHFDGAELSWLSVGDSPMWLFTRGKLVRLNDDHSMAPVLDRLVEEGELSPAEARRDSRRNMLRSAVTDEQAELVDSARRSCSLQDDEFLLVATDGIETLSLGEIERLLADAKGDTDAAADALLAEVRHAADPDQDNVTFLLLSGGGEASAQAADSDDTLRLGEPTWHPGRALRSPWLGLAAGFAFGILVTMILLWGFGGLAPRWADWLDATRQTASPDEHPANTGSFETPAGEAGQSQPEPAEPGSQAVPGEPTGDGLQPAANGSSETPANGSAEPRPEPESPPGPEVPEEHVEEVEPTESAPPDDSETLDSGAATGTEERSPAPIEDEPAGDAAPSESSASGTPDGAQSR